MTEMHTSMQKLMNAQEEMRAQIEVLQRAMRNHFTHANGPLQPPAIMTTEEIADSNLSNLNNFSGTPSNPSNLTATVSPLNRYQHPLCKLICQAFLTIFNTKFLKILIA